MYTQVILSWCIVWRVNVTVAVWCPHTLYSPPSICYTLTQFTHQSLHLWQVPVPSSTHQTVSHLPKHRAQTSPECTIQPTICTQTIICVQSTQSAHSTLYICNTIYFKTEVCWYNCVYNILNFCCNATFTWKSLSFASNYYLSHLNFFAVFPLFLI